MFQEICGRAVDVVLYGLDTMYEMRTNDILFSINTEYTSRVILGPSHLIFFNFLKMTLLAPCIQVISHRR